MNDVIKVLVVEDNPPDAVLMERELRKAGLQVQVSRIETESEFRAHLDRDIDLILSDFSLPQFDGLRALELLQESGKDIPFILVSGSLGEETAVTAMRQGATDYLLKDRLARLGQAVIQALTQSRLRRERASMEDTLRETEARLRSIFENTVEGIFQCTPEGRLITANPALAKIFGYASPEEMVAQIHDFGTQLYADDDRRKELMTELLHQPFVSGFEIRIRRKDGAVQWSAINARAIRKEGRIDHIDGTLEDISERKRLENQLLRAQRLESLGRLAGGIAHDLNNLLSPVLMAPSLLRDRLTDASSLKLLDAIEASATRGADIIKQLLTFSRGTDGPLRPLLLDAVVSGIVKIISQTFPRSITLRQEVMPGLPPVLGDPTQLEQVIMNLCVNARDAMPEGGILTLSAEVTHVDESLASLNPGAHAGRHVMLKVSDSGTGISPENLDSIFDPFFTTKELGKGTGLGLSTVLGIVRSHGGLIQVTSHPGKGTQFMVYLPVCESRQDATEEPISVSTDAGKGECILVVDDESIIRETVREVLLYNGYEVLEAVDGAAALVQYHRHRDRICAVITDSMMPELDGADLIKELRAIGAQVPIVAMTGLRESFDPQFFQSLGVEAFIEKPFRNRDLLEAIRRLLSMQKP